MLDTIVFDIGNVCVTFDPYTFFIKKFKDEEKTKRLCTLMFDDEAWLGYDEGSLLLEDLYAIYHQKYPQYSQEMDWMLENWLRLMNPIAETLDVMKQLKQKGYRIYLLSNISKDSADHLKQTTSFFSFADGAVLSYELHSIKPDDRIYEELFHRYALQPSHCVFLDDVAENIEKAEVFGMKGILADDLQGAYASLWKLLDKEGVSC